MDGRFFYRMVLGIVLVAALIGIGVYVFDAGMAQGLAEGARATGQTPAAQVYPYGYRGPWFHPFGWGLGILFPILFFFLIFGLVRAILWRPFYGWHGGERMTQLEDWHRRMHESQPSTGQTGEQGTRS